MSSSNEKLAGGNDCAAVADDKKGRCDDFCSSAMRFHDDADSVHCVHIVSTGVRFVGRYSRSEQASNC